MNVTDRYLTDAYLNENPTWDEEDSPWKASLVIGALGRMKSMPQSIADVGCGAGGILAAIREDLPNARLHGYEIAPDASRFWSKHSGARVDYRVCDFLSLETEHYDVILLLDVIEHLENPFEFLRAIRPRADHFIFHVPLDLSAVSVLRETPLMHVRRKVGHIHYFSKTLALSLIEECGMEIVDWRYTGAGLNAPRRSWKTKLMGMIRRTAYGLNHDFGTRLLGGETLLVTARPR